MSSPEGAEPQSPPFAGSALHVWLDESQCVNVTQRPSPGVHAAPSATVVAQMAPVRLQLRPGPHSIDGFVSATGAQDAPRPASGCSSEMHVMFAGLPPQMYPMAHSWVAMHE